MFGLGFWLAPVVLVALLVGVGIGVGFASGTVGGVSTLQDDPDDPIDVTPVPQPAQPAQPATKAVVAPRRNAAEGEVVRFLRMTKDGRFYQVRDLQGRLFQALVTPQTVVKKGGKKIRPIDIQVGYDVVGLAPASRTACSKRPG